MSYNRDRNRQPYNNNRYRPPYNNNYGSQPYRGHNQAEQVSNLVAQALADIEKKKSEANEKQALLKAMQAMQQTVTEALKRNDGPIGQDEAKRIKRSKKEAKNEQGLSSQEDDEIHLADLVDEWDPDTVTTDQVKHTASKILPLTLILGIRNCETPEDVSNLIKSRFKSGSKLKKPQLLAMAKKAGSSEKSLKKIYDFVTEVAKMYFEMVISSLTSDMFLPIVKISLPLTLEESEHLALRAEATELGSSLLMTQPKQKPRFGLRNWVTKYVSYCRIMTTLFCANSTSLPHISAILSNVTTEWTRMGWLAKESWYVPNIIYLAFHLVSGSFYIGETSLNLAQRVFSHFASLKTSFAQRAWSSPSQIIFLPIHHCHTVIGRQAPMQQKKFFRKKVEYLLIRSLTPDMNGEFSKYAKKKFSAPLQQRILSSLLHRTPSAIKSWKIMLYKVHVTDGFSPIETTSLESCLLSVPDCSLVTISIIKHGHNISDFERCRKLFPGSKAIGHGSKMSSPFNKSKLFSTPITILLNNPSRLQPKHVLDMKNPSAEYLIGALQSAQGLRDFELEKALISKLRILYGVKLRKKYILKIHESLNAPDSYVRELVSTWLDTYDMPASIKALLRRRLYISRTQSRNIGDFLFNYRQFDDKVDLKQPECTCGTLLGDHLKVLASNHSDALVAHAGNLGAHFVPRQTYGAVLKAVQIQPLIKAFLDAVPLSLRHHLIGKTAPRSQDLLHNILAYGYTSRDDSTFSIDALHTVRETLRGLIVSPCDKNNKVMLIECPVIRINSLKQAYIGVPHYEPTFFDNEKACEKEKTSILRKMDVFLLRDDIKTLDSKLQGARLPYNYILSKFKDIRRSRPVTSYFYHPLKKVFRKIGAALNHLLITWTAPHFNLDKVADVPIFLDRATEWKEKMARFGLTTAEGQWDVKEMFTNIPQSAIITSVELIMASFVHRCLWVSLDGNQNKVRALKTREAVLKIDFNTMLRTVAFDINMAFSTLGSKVILKQKIGIPIGGIMSSTIARIVVSVMEYRILTSQPVLQHLTLGGRYTDDLRLYTASFSPDAAAELAATFVKHTYTSGLHVVPDEQPTDNFVFVGLKGTTQGSYHPFNKNEHQCLSGEKQKFIRFQSASSSVSRIQKYAGIVGALVYIADHSASADDIKKAFITTVAEFSNLGFPRSFIINAYNKALYARPMLSVINNYEQLIDQTLTIIRTKS